MGTLELIASLLGALAVWMVVKRNILNFPIGIVMVSLYAWIFWEAKLYSDMLLQVVFAFMQVQGWYLWSKKGASTEEQSLAVRSMQPRHWMGTGVVQVVGTLGLGYVMSFTDASLPYLDAFAAVQSILAQWWLNKRYLENWILWIAVDELYLVIYSYKSLYYTTALYALFLGMAVAGYLEWRKHLTHNSGR
jgi:nicotinamide mononucleotide transporter